ncbi:AraC family transcriptional regulator [Sorangium sp. So ce134]
MDLPQKVRALHASPALTVLDFDCACGRQHPAPEEASASTDFAFVRRGSFLKESEGRSMWVDPHRVLFNNAGEVGRVRHLVDGGDRCTIFRLSEDLTRQVLAWHDAGDAERPARPFTRSDAPADSRTYLLHQLLVAELEQGPGDPLRIQERTLDLLDAALRAAGSQPRRRRLDAATQRRHRDLVHGAAELLSRHLTDPPDLIQLGQALDCSPFHLHRVFRAGTGLPIHRYVLGLRLRTALGRLLAGARSLTALALELGFADHSHFTNTFRREFGCSPSALRRLRGEPPARKILQARAPASAQHSRRREEDT